MISGWVAGAGLWAVGSLLTAEIVRDGRHVLAHAYPKWIPKHQVHHRVFRNDLSVINPETYRQSQWDHDVPESATMVVATVLLWGVCGWLTPELFWFAGVGVLYSLGFLAGGVARGRGWAVETDLTHRPGPFDQLPHPWWVNRTYHWRHHFDDPNAYFCGTFTLIDRLMGTSLSLKGKTIAITGASGSLGRSLLQRLDREGAKLIALSSKLDPVVIPTDQGDKPIRTQQWQIQQEEQLADLLETVDILILNHGVNVHGERTPEAILSSYEINTFSHWRLLEMFLKTVRSNADIARKEVWMNTSEAEVLPAVSPLYELSKRTLGDLITLRRLDAPCVIRKLILGPFKSNLNPIGVMSSDWVADKIVKWAKRDVRNIIVTIDPLTYLFLPLKELAVSTYFNLFSRGAQDPVSVQPEEPRTSAQ